MGLIKIMKKMLLAGAIAMSNVSASAGPFEDGDMSEIVAYQGYIKIGGEELSLIDAGEKADQSIRGDDYKNAAALYQACAVAGHIEIKNFLLTDVKVDPECSLADIEKALKDFFEAGNASGDEIKNR